MPGSDGKRADFVALLERAERLLEGLERFLPPPAEPPDWCCHAFRWQRGGPAGGRLRGIPTPHPNLLEELLGIDSQKAELERNTRQFLAGRPANNALLWGSRGTGKSSLVKALLNAYRDRGLRLVEVDKHDLLGLPDLIAVLAGRAEHFVLFCDDLSFEADEHGYKALKAALDGSLSAMPGNVLIYATSNRRHLLPEYTEENLQARRHGGEIHHGEAVEEKLSLSERFGLWLSFYPFDQDAYLEIVGAWLRRLGHLETDPNSVREAALRWALGRGSRSGRTALQFARDWAGRRGAAAGKDAEAES